jgi:hypothetical protein
MRCDVLEAMPSDRLCAGAACKGKSQQPKPTSLTTGGATCFTSDSPLLLASDTRPRIIVEATAQDRAVPTMWIARFSPKVSFCT